MIAENLQRGIFCASDMPLCCNFGFIVAGPERCPPHPRLKFQIHQPVFHGRNPTKIVFDVLLTNQPDGNLLAGAVPQRNPQNSLAEKNAFGVMPKRAVAKIRHKCFRFVEPIMHRQVIGRFTAK